MSVFASDSRITPFQRFKAEAEGAARFYVSIFPNLRVLELTSSELMPNFPLPVLTVNSS